MPEKKGRPQTSLVDAIAEAALARLKPALAEAQAIRSRLLTVTQAAQYLGRTPWAIRHLAATGTLPTVKMDGRVRLTSRTWTTSSNRTRHDGLRNCDAGGPSAVYR